mmetsp:Transcript_26166/g.25347  ORF Transcript_26166/g.25347 Transcript_26166/m.25347 type:complete len:105 (+) Transcript_26166:1313-1627(+)
MEEYQEMRDAIKETPRIQLLELKRALNFAFQNEAARDVGVNYYDLENYEEMEEEQDQLGNVADTARKVLPDINDLQSVGSWEDNGSVMKKVMVFKPRTANALSF